MKSMRNNFDLYQFLLELEGVLRSKNMLTLADQVGNARAYSLSSQTEFLGESRNVLVELVGLNHAILGKENVQYVEEAIKAIDVALGAHSS